MRRTEQTVDPYVGLQPIPGYYLTKKVGEGRIGSVYKAACEDPEDLLACKVIPEGKLKDGWQRELQKVVRLRTVPNVVQYHQYGSKHDKTHRQFTWILWDYIPSKNLKDYLEDPASPLDMAFIELVGETVLQVLHACRAVDVRHGDLHAGNILVSDPDPRLPGSPRRIWISDFGYGGSHNNLEPKDDYRQLFSIVSNLLHKLDPSNLNPRDKVLHQKIGEFLRKRLLEVDATQGAYVGNAEALLNDFRELTPAADRESAAAARGEELQEPGDYLWAEALGYRKEEWKNLFVPEFLAAQELLSKNITILTGARGCGKTMIFRRLTVFMDEVVGEPSGVPGADQFIGFYLNCRDLVEAFPWIPRRLSTSMEQQIIHYFHLAWFSEVCKTLALRDPERVQGYDWLDRLLTTMFANRYHSLPLGADILAHAMAFIEEEKERCRLTELGSSRGPAAWPLGRVDFLDNLQELLESHVPWIGQGPLYLFLDDYTIPIVPRSVQGFLNPIVFKRRSNLFFKVSTEAANSFEREGVRGKPLELHQDFDLIDLATESLHQDDRSRMKLLDSIFRPRIDRHPNLKGKNLGLNDVLGKSPVSNNKLASQMREAAQHGGQKRVIYHGANVFVGMWASDLRSMIQMFTGMLRGANGGLSKNDLPIAGTIQDECYRTTGGEFLVFAESVTDPAYWDREPFSTKPGERYGTHLRDIVETFVAISRYELTQGKLVANQGRLNPKQAFRLEIIDKFDLSEETHRYYSGLVRWHIFLHDWRGKSVRGMITPRLYLNRILIPFVKLTFSSHDHVQLTNEEFGQLLTNPKGFLEYWKNKRMRSTRKGRRSIVPEAPTLPGMEDQKGRFE